MPGLDGSELIHEVLIRYRVSDLPMVPVIALFDSMSTADIEEAVRHGVAVVMAKPWAKQRYRDLAQTLVTYAQRSAGTTPLREEPTRLARIAPESPDRRADPCPGRPAA